MGSGVLCGGELKQQTIESQDALRVLMKKAVWKNIVALFFYIEDRAMFIPVTRFAATNFCHEKK